MDHRNGVKSYVGTKHSGISVYENGAVLCDALDRSAGRPLQERADLVFGAQYAEACGKSLYSTWGYEGAGPKVLAASLIDDITGSEALAERYHVALTSRLIAHLPEHQFELSGERLLAELGACILEA